MDILNATLIPIEDRVYRLIPVRDDEKHPAEEKEINLPSSIYNDDDDVCDPDLPIMHQDDKFYITFYVPKILIGHIIGQKYKTLKILEQQGASIKIGSKRDGMITISSTNKLTVSSTYYKVMDRITFGRLMMDSTHFISFPINSSNIQESFLKFKENILEKYKKVRGIDETIFQKPGKLHLTVTTLVLLDDRDYQNAIAILTKCTGDILKEICEKEFIVQVKGLEYMNDDPAEVDVLYAEVHELDGDNRLQIISDTIMKEFSNANLAKSRHDTVKLHITLMNTLFRENLENKDENSKDELQRQTFDATPILHDYKDYDFGQLIISEVHISIRYTTESDGYYKAIKKVKLNS